MSRMIGGSILLSSVLDVFLGQQGVQVVFVEGLARHRFDVGYTMKTGDVDKCMISISYS